MKVQYDVYVANRLCTFKIGRLLMILVDMQVCRMAATMYSLPWKPQSSSRRISCRIYHGSSRVESNERDRSQKSYLDSIVYMRSANRGVRDDIESQVGHSVAQDFVIVFCCSSP